MPLHLIKLAVCCESVKELKEWTAERMLAAKKKGLPQHHIHITRMAPKRVEEILAGGSLYWVIRGEVAAREKVIAIEPFRDRFQIIGNRRVEIDGAFTAGTDNYLLHINVGSMQQAAFFARGDDATITHSANQAKAGRMIAG